MEAIGGIADTPRIARSQRQRTGYAFLVLALLCLLSAPFFADLIDRRAPKATNGILDVAGQSLARPMLLDGEWTLNWGRPGGPRIVAPVPGQWTGLVSDGRELPPQGLATYSLTLRNVPAGEYILFVPIQAAATRIWIDGRMVSQHGVPGDSAETTRYDLRSDDLTIAATGADIRLRIDIASFLHRDNGIMVSPVFGATAGMRKFIALDWAQDYLFPITLLLLFTYGLIIFLFRPEDRASLWFAIACLFAIIPPTIYAHDNLLLIGLPNLSFPTMVGIQYMAGTGAVACFIAYACALFPQERSLLVFRGLMLLFAINFAVQLGCMIGGETLLASEVSRWTLPLRVTGLFYMIAIVALAAKRGRDGAIVFLVGVAVFVLTLVLRGLVDNGYAKQGTVLGAELSHFGILMLMFSQVIILAERWSIAMRTSERMNDDLRRLLDVNSAITSEMQLSALLSKIVAVTSRIVKAERSSLFLHDPAKKQLWTLVAEGVGQREIRIPDSQGLAGEAFATGATINVSDAYADARFNKAVDADTGFRTKSVLTMPIVTREGKRIGVMQTLNRQDAAAFDAQDIERMRAFTAQAAIAIENASLFAEVVAARNYNEGILRSMSSGVITLDRDAVIAKPNAAACRMLGVAAEQLEGADVRRLLAGTNAWLIEEIDGVTATGEPRLLLDVDIAAAGGATVACNLSIVPLIGDDGPVGLLVILDDISESKRLQGAMRRFMTNKVVDQILQREDDLLFGSNCEASILFADIRNFTSMAEKLSPRETVDMLNEIFTELFEAVAANDGVLDKFIGDAMMAVFGVPLPSGQDARNAIESARQMERMLTVLNEKRAAAGQPALRLGIGIATGDVVAGTIGSPKRMDYTVIGDSVNLASRLQSATKDYGVGAIVCGDTADALGETGGLRELDIIRVRGRDRPVRIFEILGREGQAAVAEAYRIGRAHLVRRDWTKAADAFAQALSLEPGDRPSAIMHARTVRFAEAPPPPDWDGVWDDELLGRT